MLQSDEALQKSLGSPVNKGCIICAFVLFTNMYAIHTRMDLFDFLKFIFIVFKSVTRKKKSKT